MGKKYVMFVDERGFLITDRINSFSMIGLIFEYNYCIDSKNKQCELKTKLNQYKERILNNSNCNTFLDDILLNENTFNKINETKRKEFINELPLLFKNLKFTIISSEIKQDINNINELYSIVTKNLLKRFNSFIKKKNGECGAIIIEATDCKDSYIIQQKFFDVYNQRSKMLSTVGNIEDKINTFIVSQKDNKTYGLGIEVINILNNILFRFPNGLKKADSKLMPYIEYGDTDKVFNTIKHKIYKDTPIQISNRHLQKKSYSSTEIFNKELNTLKEQLELKDKRINEKEKEISELANDIKLLNKQLEESLLSRKSDGIILQILSDIDFKMKRIEKKSIVAKH
ncbi:MAG TPA: DUF3800 domain-containing protein [Clostridium sp.]